MFRSFFSCLAVCGLLLSACRPTSTADVYPTWTVPEVPDTPAGRQLAGYLASLNRGDREGLARFVRTAASEHGPGGASLEDRVASTQHFFDVSHGLNLYRIEASEPFAITFVAQMRLTQEWRRMRLMVEDAPPHRMLGIMIEPIASPLPKRAPLSDAQLAQEVAAYVQGLVASDRFSGVVLVARDSTPVFAGAYGMADGEAHRANTVDTRFNIASVGKLFTAVAIAQLAEAGQVRYDAPIGTYLPDLPPDVARRITVAHLLTHQSGFADVFEMGVDDGVPLHDVAAGDYVAAAVAAPLHFAPGSRFEYSNTNFELLGRIVEALSGEPFRDYVRAHVFAPAGMTETAFEDASVSVEQRAFGYTEFGEDGTLHAGDWHRWGSGVVNGSAAGGGLATAADLLRFGHALRTHRLLLAAATDTLLLDRVDYERPGYRYGYGTLTRRAGDERIVGHSGGGPGMDAQFDLYLKRGFTVVVLANREFQAEPVAMHLQELLVR